MAGKVVASVKRGHACRLAEFADESRLPLLFFVGAKDIQISTTITQPYFEKLKAPKKVLFMFERSGRQIHQDEPGKFQDTIITTLDAI